MTASISVQGSYLVGCHDLVTGDSGDEPGRIVVRSRYCHFCCHRPAGRRWTTRRRVARPNRISSSGRHGSDPFMLDQRTRSVRHESCRTALNCNPNCNRQICSSPWLPADDSVTPWSSSPPPDLFPATRPRPVLSQTPLTWVPIAAILCHSRVRVALATGRSDSDAVMTCRRGARFISAVRRVRVPRE
jgi:hypothetical protein